MNDILWAREGRPWARWLHVLPLGTMLAVVVLDLHPAAIALAAPLFLAFPFRDLLAPATARARGRGLQRPPRRNPGA